MEQQIAEFLKSESGLELIKSILQENLTVDIENKGGDYGSSKFIEISIKIGDDVISTASTYLN